MSDGARACVRAAHALASPTIDSGSRCCGGAGRGGGSQRGVAGGGGEAHAMMAPMATVFLPRLPMFSFILLCAANSAVRFGVARRLPADVERVRLGDF